jgi:hypothetical protein
MSDDDWLDAWLNPAGPEPDPDSTHAAWLTPQTGWTWDVDSLMMGEYVGYPLYLQVRDRLTTLRIPTPAHNRIIQELIDTHDMSAMTQGAARSTLICWDAGGVVVPVEIADATEFDELSGC